MRTVGVVTVARSDFGIYLPILKRIRESGDLQLRLIVSGMHLSPEFGLTYRYIEEQGFTIDHRVEMLLSSDTPESIGKSTGLGVIGFAQLYAQHRPDILFVLGDRFEMLSAVLAAVPFAIPIAHLHGGESTEGLIDECIRHSITKMSHLHFASTEGYATRIIQMGEEPWRVTVSGAPSLDNILAMRLCGEAELSESLRIPMSPKPILVTYHPVTLELQDTDLQFEQLLRALKEIRRTTLFTYPNSDTNGRRIIAAIDDFVRHNPFAHVVPNLGTEMYFSVMKHAGVMVGNSSSGIIEAASFGLPVVNVGNRQQGRMRPANVIDVEDDSRVISAAVQRALSPEFQRLAASNLNPYGDGNAAGRIVAVLEKAELNRQLLVKKFYRLPRGQECVSS